MDLDVIRGAVEEFLDDLLLCEDLDIPRERGLGGVLHVLQRGLAGLAALLLERVKDLDLRLIERWPYEVEFRAFLRALYREQHRQGHRQSAEDPGPEDGSGLQGGDAILHLNSGAIVP